MNLFPTGAPLARGRGGLMSPCRTSAPASLRLRRPARHSPRTCPPSGRGCRPPRRGTRGLRGGQRAQFSSLEGHAGQVEWRGLGRGLPRPFVTCRAGGARASAKPPPPGRAAGWSQGGALPRPTHPSSKRKATPSSSSAQHLRLRDSRQREQEGGLSREAAASPASGQKGTNLRLLPPALWG